MLQTETCSKSNYHIWKKLKKKGQKSELFNLPVDDCKVMREQDTDTVHLYNPHNKY